MGKTATKPVKLQLNNSGAWKDLARFDAADADRADAIMNASAQLAAAANDGHDRPQLTLRIVTDESHPAVLMRYIDRDGAWRDAATGERA